MSPHGELALRRNSSLLIVVEYWSQNITFAALIRFDLYLSLCLSLTVDFDSNLDLQAIFHVICRIISDAGQNFPESLLCGICTHQRRQRPIHRPCFKSLGV